MTKNGEKEDKITCRHIEKAFRNFNIKIVNKNACLQGDSLACLLHQIC